MSGNNEEGVWVTPRSPKKPKPPKNSALDNGNGDNNNRKCPKLPSARKKPIAEMDDWNKGLNDVTLDGGAGADTSEISDYNSSSLGSLPATPNASSETEKTSQETDTTIVPQATSKDRGSGSYTSNSSPSLIHGNSSSLSSSSSAVGSPSSSSPSRPPPVSLPSSGGGFSTQTCSLPSPKTRGRKKNPRYSASLASEVPGALAIPTNTKKKKKKKKASTPIKSHSLQSCTEISNVNSNPSIVTPESSFTCSQPLSRVAPKSRASVVVSQTAGAHGLTLSTRERSRTDDPHANNNSSNNTLSTSKVKNKPLGFRRILTESAKKFGDKSIIKSQESSPALLDSDESDKKKKRSFKDKLFGKRKADAPLLSREGSGSHIGPLIEVDVFDLSPSNKYSNQLVCEGQKLEFEGLLSDEPLGTFRKWVVPLIWPEHISYVKLKQQFNPRYFPGLEQVLSNQRLLTAFNNSLRKTLCDEPLSFVIACSRFVETIIGGAKSLANTYIYEGSKNQVNIDSDMRLTVEEAVESTRITSWLFVNAQTYMLEMLSSDSIPKFLRSDAYKTASEVPKPTIPLPVKRDDSLLHQAAYTGDFETVKSLLLRGASMLVPDEEGHLPLHAAALSGKYKVCNLLLEFNAPVNAYTRTGNIALHYISNHFYNDKEVIEVMDVIRKMAHKGVDINAASTRFETPLHYSCFGKAPASLVKFLLRWGADPNSKNKRGLTPLHNAIVNTAPEHVKVLLENGADPGITQQGRTCLELAEQMSSVCPELVTVLEEYTALQGRISILQGHIAELQRLTRTALGHKDTMEHKKYLQMIKIKMQALIDNSLLRGV